MLALSPTIERAADLTDSSPTLLIAILALFLALSISTVWRLTVIRIRHTEKGPELKASLMTWWGLITLISVALIIGRLGVIAVCCVVSVMALREFLQLLPDHLRRGRSWLYIAVVLQYVWIALQWTPLVVAFIPVMIFLILPLRAISAGRVEGFTTVYGWKLLGLILTTLTLCHVPLIFELRGGDPVKDSLLVLYLLILTEGNDIAQSLWGRAFGKRRIVPRVSPSKCLEGFIGGISTTVAMAMLLSPVLTDFADQPTWVERQFAVQMPLLMAACVGLLVAIAGIAGDLTLSAIKRDAGVKDTGTILPGHGGVLDRADSLLFTAPTFFWLMVLFSH